MPADESSQEVVLPPWLGSASAPNSQDVGPAAVSRHEEAYPDPAVTASAGGRWFREHDLIVIVLGRLLARPSLAGWPAFYCAFWEELFDLFPREVRQRLRSKVLASELNRLVITTSLVLMLTQG